MWRLHFFMFLCEASARMITVGMLGVVLRGWPIVLVILGMFLARLPLTLTSRKRDTAVAAASSLISTYFCRENQTKFRVCVVLMCVEGLVSGILFNEFAVVQHDMKAACLAVLGVCGIISVIGMLLRPFISTANTSVQKAVHNLDDYVRVV